MRLGDIRVRLGLESEVARTYPSKNKIARRTDGVLYRKLLYGKATPDLKSISFFSYFLNGLGVHYCELYDPSMPTPSCLRSFTHLS